jgi:serine/threonine-protein kinase RsbW
VSDAPKQIELLIDSRLHQASLVGTCIRALCEQHGIDATRAFQIQTATIEAVNNAIIHAYGRQPGQQVRVSWLKAGSELTIEVSDTGMTMATLPPDVEPPLEAEGGRGWWIMRRWMDHAEYRQQDGWNTMTLRASVG